MVHRHEPECWAALVLALSVTSCERGCARHWLREHGVGRESSPSVGTWTLNAIDCPDGLARCREGVVEVSQRTTITQPCKGPPERCACPWERAGECEGGCAADGVELVIERDRASAQLCAPRLDAGAVVTPRAGVSPYGCDEGEAYRCTAGVVVACAVNAVIAACVHGCLAEGASIEDGIPVTREAAFAILCSR